MPIGSSKLGVLGAGLVPGGSVTFNTSGNWAVPPGVKKVSITGKGATGNPGNPGNPGNAGNPGSGGAGAGASQQGGNAFNAGPIAAINTSIGVGNNAICQGWASITAPNPLFPRVVRGGNSFVGAVGNPGQSGNSGGAGSAGSAGSAGNPGQASSGLGNTFPGGAGGNAGNAGAAGTGGSGGQGGSIGQVFQPSFPRPVCQPIIGGAGGNGGGSGGTMNKRPSPPAVWCGAIGGGGAGVTNDGQPGTPTTPPIPVNTGLGGADTNAQATATLTPAPVFPWSYPFQNNITTNTTGGSGANPFFNAFATVWSFRGPGSSPLVGPLACAPQGRIPQVGSRFVNEPANSNLWRAGGGGSGTFLQAPSPGCACNNRVYGAGGGGGRGNAGNPGGAGGGVVLAPRQIQLHSIALRSRRALRYQSQSHLPEVRSSFPGILSSRKTGWQRENLSKFSRLGG